MLMGTSIFWWLSSHSQRRRGKLLHVRAESRMDKFKGKFSRVIPKICRILQLNGKLPYLICWKGVGKNCFSVTINYKCTRNVGVLHSINNYGQEMNTLSLYGDINRNLKLVIDVYFSSYTKLWFNQDVYSEMWDYCLFTEECMFRRFVVQFYLS